MERLRGNKQCDRESRSERDPVLVRSLVVVVAVAVVGGRVERSGATPKIKVVLQDEATVPLFSATLPLFS